MFMRHAVFWLTIYVISILFDHIVAETIYRYRIAVNTLPLQMKDLASRGSMSGVIQISSNTTKCFWIYFGNILKSTEREQERGYCLTLYIIS